MNSIHVRLAQVLQWLRTTPSDIVALQETKIPDDKFPLHAIHEAGYQAIYCGQKSYNGVALLSKLPATDVMKQLPDFDDPQQRLLAATYGDIRVINVYVPNGDTVGSEKYRYKLAWLTKLNAFLSQQLHQYPKLLLLGDFNIAPEDKDVHDPKKWQGHVLVSEPERQAFNAILACGLHDGFRHITTQAGHYTWWDYRGFAFRRNHGLRIDHILTSDSLLPHLQTCQIDKTPRTWERPSDHVPVSLLLSLS